MSAPKNIQRDGVFFDPHHNTVQFGTSSSISTGSPLYNSDGITYVDVGQAQIAFAITQTLSTGNQKIIGVNMSPPVDDRWPFRIKASLNIPTEPEYVPGAAIVTGYSPTTITGTDDVISSARYWPFHGRIDELFIFEPDRVGTYVGRAFVIGLALHPRAQLTSDTVIGHLSVQNLGLKPPTMQNAVS